APQAVDAAVIAYDHIGVVGVSVRRGVAGVVATDRSAGIAEDHVAAVGALRREGQAEEIGAAADDVVLAAIAEDGIVAAAALAVVIAVGGRLEGGLDKQRAVGLAVGGHRVGPGAIGVERDGGVALNDVVAQFAEDLVVAGAARHGVAAVGGRRRRVRVVEQRDRAVENAGGVRLGTRGVGGV